MPPYLNITHSTRKITMPLPLCLIKFSASCLLLLAPSFIVAQSCNSNITATTDHLMDNNKGIIYDPKTALEWKKCSEGQLFNSGENSCTGTTSRHRWEAALEHAQALNAKTVGENFGNTDWRVPTISELDSIVELSCDQPTINATVFPATLRNFYWSSSPNASFNTHAWNTNFHNGSNSPGNKFSNLNSVRLVRSRRIVER